MATAPTIRPIRPQPTSRLSAPFLWVEWAFQWIAYAAGNLAVFQVLEYAGKLGVLVAVITWISEIQQRQDDAIRTAWSVVNAKGGGRQRSLEFLVKKNVDLRGMYGAGGFFAKIDLSGRRDLSWSNLEEANFSNANLTGAILQDSVVSGTLFKDAVLRNADFQRARFYPLAPDFTGADIDHANFKGISVGSSATYRSLASAKNWKTAEFDPDLRQAIGCVENAADPKCTANVPELLQGADPVENQLFVTALMGNITCELRDAFTRVREEYKNSQQQLTGQNDPRFYLDTWGVETTLALTSANAHFSSRVTRANKVNGYYLVSDLLQKGACNAASRPNAEFMMQSDLKLADWLFSIVEAGELTDNPVARKPRYTAVQHEIEFVIIANGSSGPKWSISHLVSKPESGSDRQMPIQHLIITFGPANKGGPANAAQPSPQAAAMHSSALLSLGFGNRNENAQQR